VGRWGGVVGWMVQLAWWCWGFTSAAATEPVAACEAPTTAASDDSAAPSCSVCPTQNNTSGTRKERCVCKADRQTENKCSCLSVSQT
jgi:hypothetical protein